MAVYFLRSKHFSRGKGSRVTRAAAYRAGERIRDERTGEIHDYSERCDVGYKEVVLPADLAGRPDMAWTQDRATLWNAAEHAGRRCNSRLAREFLVLIPPELTSIQRAHLVRGFAQELADRYRCAVDMALHTPRPGADRRNHHAHLLMTVREVTPDGPGSRTTLELGGRERHQRGLAPSKDDYLAIRQRWAELTNGALQRAGLATRIDHRSFTAQGIDREPTATIPEKVFYAERRSGAGSIAGDSIRARHRERLAARVKGSGELERVVQRQKQQLRESAIQDGKQNRVMKSRARWASLTREERNAVRREQYRARREVQRQDPDREARRRELARQRYHASFRKDPDGTRQRRQAYRKAHAEEINRNQREYRRVNAEELNRRRREHRQARAREENRDQPDHRPMDAGRSPDRSGHVAPSPTPQESARSWSVDREVPGPEQDAERSAQEWKSSRERKEPESTPDGSAREWLAKREGRTVGDSAQGPETELPRDTDDAEDGRMKRQRDYDFES